MQKRRQDLTPKANGAKHTKKNGAKICRRSPVPKTIVLAPESLFGAAFLAPRQILAPGFGAKSWRRCFFCFWRRWFLAPNLILAPFLHLAPRCSWLASACTGPPSSLHRFRRAAKHSTLPASGRPAYLGTGPTNKLHNSSIQLHWPVHYVARGEQRLQHQQACPT